MAVFFAIFQSGNAPPHNSFLSVPGPGTAFVRRPALSTNQNFRQCVFRGVFALFGLTALLHHFSFAGPAGHLLLHPLEDRFGNDRRMVIFDVVHGPVSLIFHYLFADTVRDICFLEQGIPDILLVCQDVTDHLIGPCFHSLCCRNTVGFYSNLQKS